jgi:hypothetical protein
MPTNCQRRSYGPGWVPEGTGICMANRTDWPGAMLPAGLVPARESRLSPTP